MISVCIPTYNGEKYIKEQLDSILCQLSEIDEVIISDDSSTDNTLEIINNYNDKRIKLFINNHFYSPIFNLENALNHANGDYIFLSDQDDIWMPNKVKITLKALEQFDLSVSDCELIDSKGNIISNSFYLLNQSGNGFIKNLIKNSYLGCCMAFKRDVLRYTLPFPKNIAMHDIWIGLCVELSGKSVFVNEKLIKYRRHENNLSSAGSISKNNVMYKLKYRLVMLFLLFQRKACN